MLKRLLLVITVLFACVGCDQTTKVVATAYLSETEAVSFLGGSVRLQVAKNYGAFLSLGSSMPEPSRTALLVAGVAVFLVGLFIYSVVSTSANPLFAPALGMVVGGGVSNLADRLLYGGDVVDFLNVGLGPVRTGIFNLADVFITSGALFIVFGEVMMRRDRNAKS